MRGASDRGRVEQARVQPLDRRRKKDAPGTVYVFTDPNCPYCSKFWADARPWVDSGAVVLRHVMVGILTPTSAGRYIPLRWRPGKRH